MGVADGIGVADGVYVGVGVAVGVGVRLGKMGVLLGVSVALSGELSPKFRFGSMVGPGGGGVKVGGMAKANNSSCTWGMLIGAARVGKAGCSTQAAWVSSKYKQQKINNFPRLIAGIARIIPFVLSLCQH